MITMDTLFKLGVPRVRPASALAVKAANVAVSQGQSPETVKKLVETLCRSDRPETVPLGETAELWAPFVEALLEVRKGQTFFAERAEPAPWRSWAHGTLEESAVKQMHNACRLPIAVGGALMPDAHTGYGLPIGGVLAVKNAVIPFAVGVDIACRMRVTILDMPYERLETDGDRFAEAIESETRFGVGATFENGAHRTHPVMALDWSITPPTKNNYGKAARQLGTSGSGNHFVEFGRLTVPHDIDEPTLKLKAGTYAALLSHSGSRGAGEAVADYYSALAQSLHPELPVELRHLAWLELDTKPGQEYWQAMQLMGRYAAANHELIHRHILERLGLKALGHVENHHNFAWKEVHDGQELIVHRKGATPAGKGVLGIVPGSMATPAYVVRGKGNSASFCSCSHGAGRVMSRKNAFATLSIDAMHTILKEKGVRLLSGPLDESPEVYKNIEEVMAAQTDLVDVLATFEPKIVKMAPEEGCRPKWIKSKKPRGQDRGG